MHRFPLLTIDGFGGAVAGALVVFAALTVIRRPSLGPALVAAVAFLLPFSVPPMEIAGLSPSSLDWALFLALVAWWLPLLKRLPPKPITGPIGGLIVLFCCAALTSFLLALDLTSPQQARMFLKLINSVLCYFTVLNVLRTPRDLDLTVRVVVLGGVAAATFGVGLYLLPESTDYWLRNALSDIGYPGGSSIVRQIAGTDIRRATGTAVDPNLLGGMLGLTVPLATALAVGDRPARLSVIARSRRSGRPKQSGGGLLPGWFLWPAVLLMLAAQVLTYSRGAWLASGMGLTVVALLRYPRAWLVLLVIPLFLLLPQGAVMVDRAASAVVASDPASQMRLGEYRDALSVIGRFPVFGTGFGQAPEGVAYVGVSSVYLFIGELMGLVGLALFLVVIGTLVRFVLPALRGGRPDPVLAGAAGSVAAALAAGLVDHYFFNPQIPPTTTLLWLFLGLLTSAAAQRRRSDAAQPPTSAG